MKTPEDILDSWIKNNPMSYKILINAMEEYADQFKPKWIDVKVELPVDTTKYYQVTIRDASVGKRWVAQLKFNGENWIGEGLDNLTWVTHWRNLPEPA